MSRKISRRKWNEALDAAAFLVEQYDVKLFTLPRAMSRGVWQTRGGMGETTPGDGNGIGYLAPPKGYQDRLVPGDLTPIDQMMKNTKRALCALMGDVLQANDIDVKDGGHLTRARLVKEGRYPTRIVGRVRTPSGGDPEDRGEHDFTQNMGIGSPSPTPLHHGIDVKGGRPDGTGRGMVILPPTLKLSKTTGELERYEWLMLPKPRKDHKRLDKGARAFIEDARGVVGVSARSARTSLDTDAETRIWEDQPVDERKRLDKYLDVVLKAELGRLANLTALKLPDEEYRSDPARYTGPSWRNTVFEVACILVELAQAGWTDYGLVEALADFLNESPKDARYTRQALEWHWESARLQVGIKTRPYPLARPAAVEPDLTFNYIPRSAR